MSTFYGQDRAPVVNDRVDISQVDPQYSSAKEAWIYWWDPEREEGVAQTYVSDEFGYDHIYITAQDLGRLPVVALAGDSDDDHSFWAQTDDLMRMH